jgi:hypothetical protein
MIWLLGLSSRVLCMSVGDLPVPRMERGEPHGRIEAHEGVRLRGIVVRREIPDGDVPVLARVEQEPRIARPAAFASAPHAVGAAPGRAHAPHARERLDVQEAVRVFEGHVKALTSVWCVHPPRRGAHGARC